MPLFYETLKHKGTAPLSELKLLVTWSDRLPAFYLTPWLSMQAYVPREERVPQVRAEVAESR